MAELWKITLPSGNTYELKDKYARDLIAQLLNFNHYLGVTTTALVEDDTTNPIIISGESVTATAGDVVTLSSDNSEMIYNSLGKWQKFGTLSGLGLLAYKDSASASYTPAGSISASFTGDATTSTGTFTPEGSISGSFSGNEVTSTGTYTPVGSVSSSFTGTATTSTGTFTPEGSVSSTGGTKTIKQFKTAGEMPTYTVADGNLTITAGTTPTGEDVSVGDGSVNSTFTGTEGNLSVSGTPSGSISSTFTGTEGNLSVAGTPTGSISASFTGTEGSVSVSGTPTGSISGSFTGNAATITVS